MQHLHVLLVLRTISSISVLHGGGGYPEHRYAGISTATYDSTTGLLSITSANHGIETGDNVQFQLIALYLLAHRIVMQLIILIQEQLTLLLIGG